MNILNGSHTALKSTPPNMAETLEISVIYSLCVIKRLKTYNV